MARARSRVSSLDSFDDQNRHLDGRVEKRPTTGLDLRPGAERRDDDVYVDHPLGRIVVRGIAPRAVAEGRLSG
jgi:hypothetical protein